MIHLINHHLALNLLTLPWDLLRSLSDRTSGLPWCILARVDPMGSSSRDSQARHTECYVLYLQGKKARPRKDKASCKKV